MKAKLVPILIATLIAASFAVSCDKRKGDPGTAQNPVRLYFMPLKGKQAYEKYAPKLEQFLEANSGLAVETIYADDFVTIVEAFGKKKADVAFMNTLGYLMAHDWAKAEAHLRYLYGDVYDTYRGEILVRTDGDIDKIEDLNGKTIAFADPFSASGYLYPLKLLHDKKVKPKKTIFAEGHIKGVDMLYGKKVDAACVYHERPSAAGDARDARTELTRRYPDIIAKTKILTLTDEIPSGPIALRKELASDVKSKLTGSILQFARTPEGRDTIHNLYNITGFALARDADYDGVREALKELGKSIDEVIPGGVTFYRENVESWMEY